MEGNCKIDVRFFRPPPELDGCFTSFYRLEVEVADGSRVEDWLQPEWGNIRFFSGDTPDANVPNGDSLSGAAMTASGPTSLAIRFRLGATRAWGIGLFPLGWAKFADVEAYRMANRLFDGCSHPVYGRLAPLTGKLFDGPPDDDAEYERIVAHFREINRPHPDEERIKSVHAALVDEGVTNVAQFAESCGIGQRTLERLCQRYFGFRPKLLLRRQRFMRSLADFMVGSRGNWTEALDEQYHDQPQFTREFRSFMTMSPRDYARLDHPILAAFMVERARIWGSAAQTLDKPTG